MQAFDRAERHDLVERKVPIDKQVTKFILITVISLYALDYFGEVFASIADE